MVGGVNEETDLRSLLIFLIISISNISEAFGRFAKQRLGCKQKEKLLYIKSKNIIDHCFNQYVWIYALNRGSLFCVLYGSKISVVLVI